MKKIYIILILLLTINNYASHKWEWTFPDWNDFVIYSVDCLDSNNCLALGRNTFTVVLRSTNGGKVWKKIHDENRNNGEPIPQPDVSWDIDYTSENTFYISYNFAMIKKTTDMGKTFDTVQVFDGNQYVHLREMFMLDDNNGMTSYSNNIWVTNDGWKTWKKIENPEMLLWASGLDYWMFDENNFTYTDNYGYFWRTTDAGETWNGAYFDKIDSVYPAMTHYYFVDDSLGFMVGDLWRDIGQTSKDIIWKTTSGGISWDLIYNREYDKISYQWNWGLQRVAFKDELNGVAVGQSGKVLSTADGGETWVQEFLVSPYNQSDTIKSSALNMNVTYAGSHPIITATLSGIWRGTQIPTSINIPAREQNKIITYPNPCYNYLYFEFPQELHGNLTTIHIIDINGNLVAQEEIYTQQGRLKYIHGITTTGSYFWQMEVGGELYSGKFIVE